MRACRQLPATWSADERMLSSGAFESVQRVLLPAPVVEATLAGARLLGERYWQEVERSTLGLVRARPATGAPRLRLLGAGPALLVFGHPDVVARHGTVSSVYSIRGGLLARSPGGAISFSQTGTTAVELRSSISDFFPRLGKRRLLYGYQARVHAWLARRYFTGLWREAEAP